jgi:polysaccharide export outer membrane protein
MTMRWIIGAALAGLLVLAGCGGGGGEAPAPTPAAVTATGEPVGYVLGTGDHIRVTVFGEPDLSVSSRSIQPEKFLCRWPATLKSAGCRLREGEKAIAQTLAQGYLANPRVNIEVLNYRPFYIHGEVKTPGSYPYVNGMSVLTAVALAGGYTYRAREDHVVITRATDPQKREVPATPDTPVLPGDIVRVPERFF